MLKYHAAAQSILHSFNKSGIKQILLGLEKVGIDLDYFQFESGHPTIKGNIWPPMNLEAVTDVILEAMIDRDL